MDPVDRAELLADRGIVGNADQGGRRQVTLLAAEAWRRVEDTLGESVDPASRRANILLSGIDLEETRDRVLRLGGVRVRIRGETRPCTLMDDARPGLRSALDPDWRGGVFGVILDSGSVAVGDGADWVEEGP